MSAALYWQAMEGQYVPLNTPSAFIVALAEAIGTPPIVISEEHLPVLRGMRAAMSHEREGIDRLVEAIQNHEHIRVWVRS